MLVKFSMDRIKNMDKLYTWTDEYSEEFGYGKIENYHGHDYCKSVVSTLGERFIIRDVPAEDKIATELFTLISDDDQEYRVLFDINTYEKKIARLDIAIRTIDKNEYDHNLEFLKIALKNNLIPDWKECTWLIDEQSAKLCKEAFEHAYMIENYLRAFASKVLIHFLGVDWKNRAGLEKHKESIDYLQESFKKRIPDMEDINTDFLSMTLETLAKIMLEGVVYKDEIILSLQDYDMVVKISSKSQNDSNILNYIKGKRQVDVDIWKDLFVPYIDNCNEFKATLHSFIEDRNHIAHSKVLSWSAYQTILMDFQRIKEQIKCADEKYELDEASEETTAKWIIEQEQQDNIELYEIEYYRDRLKNEAGLDILDEGEIEDWFDSTLLENLYNKIYNRYHLDLCFDISDYSSPSENSTIFTISCSVDDVELYIEVNAECTIDDELGGDSICSILAINGKGETIRTANIYIHNGNGIEGEEGLMEPTEDTELETSELDEFLEVLIEEIDALNHYPAQLNALILASKGTEQFVADFPCELCGKLGVSVNEMLLPIGKCCYCGYENEVKRCARCESIVEELENDLCLSCSKFVEKQ